MKRYENEELGCAFTFPDDTPQEEINRFLMALGHRVMCTNTLLVKPLCEPYKPMSNAKLGLWLPQLEPQEAMEQATGKSEEDWEEYCKYLDGKLPLERDRE